MRESELEKKFTGMVRKAGGKAYKFVSPGNDGMPDRLVVLPGGRMGFVELKQKGRKPRKLQRFRMTELEALGCFTAVVDGPESAACAIRSIAAQDGPYGLFSELVNRAPYGGKP